MVKMGLRQPEECWDCLVVASGILLDILEVRRYCQRERKKKTGPQGAKRSTIRPPRRHFVFIPLPFTFSRLEEPSIFNIFRRLLWFTSMHFDSCFDTGTWSKDNCGLYGRAHELRIGLVQLSKLHNRLCDALKQFRRRKTNLAFALIGSAFELHEAIVRTYHHRQFPDILAIMLLIERAGLSEIQICMATNLYDWATTILHENDPRRHMFRTLASIPWDTTGDLYLAFDAYCRHLWMSRGSGTNQIKAYYSYNQASLPRADDGRFYDLYRRKSLAEIDLILKQVDEQLGVYSHPTFCLWHTAIRYLLKESRLAEAECVARSLSQRLLQAPHMIQDQGDIQLNVDILLSFFLLGSAQHSLLLFENSMHSFVMCIKTRRMAVSEYNWDPTIAFALEEADSMARRLGNFIMAEGFKRQLDGMYAAVEEKDRMQQSR